MRTYLSIFLLMVAVSLPAQVTTFPSNVTVKSLIVSGGPPTIGQVLTATGTNGSLAYSNAATVGGNLTFVTSLGTLVLGVWDGRFGVSNVTVGEMSFWLEEPDTGNEWAISGVLNVSNVTLAAIPGTGTNVGITAGGTLFRTDVAGGGSSVAAPISSVQFNSNGAMFGSSKFTFTNNVLTVPSVVITNGVIVTNVALFQLHFASESQDLFSIASPTINHGILYFAMEHSIFNIGEWNADGGAFVTGLNQGGEAPALSFHGYHGGSSGPLSNQPAVLLVGAKKSGFEVGPLAGHETVLEIGTGYDGLSRLVTIRGSGNVGIGTNHPEQKLHVNGSILIHPTNSGPNYMRISNTNGNQLAAIGSWPGGTERGTLYLGNGGLTSGNFALMSDADTLYVNAPISSLIFSVASVGQWYLETDNFYPNVDAVRNLGKPANRIKNAFFLGVSITNGSVGLGTMLPSSSLDVPGEGRFGTLIASNATVPILNVTTLNASTINLTNALGSNQVRLAITNLTDVSVPGRAAGDVLFWNPTMFKWTNGQPAGGGSVSGNSNQIPFLNVAGTGFLFGSHDKSAPGFGMVNRANGNIGALLVHVDENEDIGLVQIGPPNPASNISGFVPSLSITNRYAGDGQTTQEMVRVNFVDVDSGSSAESFIQTWRSWVSGTPPASTLVSYAAALRKDGQLMVAHGTFYPSNSLAATMPTAAQLGPGGIWVGNSNASYVAVRSLNGTTTTMTVLVP